MIEFQPNQNLPIIPQTKNPTGLVIVYFVSKIYNTI